MKYYSLNKTAPEVGFKEAVIRGLAPDKGLYFPTAITPLTDAFFSQLSDMDTAEIGYEVIRQFVGKDIEPTQLRRIVAETLSFPIPLKKITDQVSVLELFHGPTLAFKDVGARFMARCLAYFQAQKSTSQEVTVLVATSGDTGGAVAHGFYQVEGVKVVILYPSGKVSGLQEKQLTTLGANISALEVQGTFDDCQAMVKQAFLDQDILSQRQLTSANSINVARWLPQMFYYFMAYQQRQDISKPWVVSVPSGNYGNICAGMMARRLGLKIDHFVAGTNANDVIPKYLASGDYQAQPSVATISNAMDVGDPSNFVRIDALFEGNWEGLKEVLSSYSFTDAQTLEAICSLYEQTNYVADPHGSVGYLALERFLETHPQWEGAFLETAHPVKFQDVMPKELLDKIPLPQRVKGLMDQPKQSTVIDSYSQLKSYLLDT